MSAAGLQLTGTIITAILSLFAIWMTVRPTAKKNKSDAAQSLFNELQEERAELKRERTELKTKVEAIERELRAAHQRELIRDDFIQDLRNHIRKGLGPPPPAWPEELRHS